MLYIPNQVVDTYIYIQFYNNVGVNYPSVNYLFIFLIGFLFCYLSYDTYLHRKGDTRTYSWYLTSNKYPERICINGLLCA